MQSSENMPECPEPYLFLGNLKILSPTPPIFLMLYVKGQFTQGRAQAEQRTHKVQLLVIPCSHKMYRDFVLP